ncbi:MAG: ascorbate system component [Thermoanaerobacteraceae bacterium]|nr:ascorbate system component [Thermoanaerobacteraceae bacterium]
MSIVMYIVTQILGSPAILVGIMACIGLIVQQKSISDIVSGTMKTIIGFLILTIGAGAIVIVLQPIGMMLKSLFGFSGIMPTSEAIVGTAMIHYGSEGGLVMLLAFLVNIIIARFTRFKYIYLTGHIFLYLSLLVTVILSVWTPLKGPSLVIVGGVILGIYLPLIIHLVQPYMRKVTGDAPIAYAHSTNLGAFVGGFLGKFVGNPEDNIEEIKLPKWASFFRDVTLSTGITMVVIYFIISSVFSYMGDDKLVKEIMGSQHWFVWSIMQGLQFGASITVLLSGVRMVITEIVPAFKGISEKIVPDALPGLDCPVVMPYAPTAWLVGFLVSFPIGIILTFVLAKLNFQYVIIPGVIPHFFASGPAAVFGNATGGKRGAILAAVCSSILITIPNALLVPFTGDTIIATGATWGEMDYGVFGTLLGYIARLVGDSF